MKPAASSNFRPSLAYLFSRYPVVSHTFIDNEMLALEARGWHLAALALSPPKDDFRHARLNTLRAPVLYAPPPALQKSLSVDGRLMAELQSTYGNALEPEKCLRNAASLAPLARHMGISHIHVHFANRATYAALILKKLLGISFSFTPQAADFLVDLQSKKLLQGFCREAEFVVVPCHYAGERLAELCPDTVSKFVQIYNGIDPAPYQQASPCGLPTPLRLVSVGRLVEFKGFHHAIQAVALAGREGVDVRLHIQGDGPWRSRLDALAVTLGVADKIVFEGTVNIDDMRRRFAESDGFVLACTVDGRGASDMFPTVITEAMLSGLPVVSCPVAGVPEQVVDGETGFLVPSDSPEHLAAAFIRLARNPGLAARLGIAGRKRALEIFAQDATLPILEEQFRRTTPRACPAAESFAPLPEKCSLYDLTAHDSPRELDRLWRADVSTGRGILLAGAGQALTRFPVPPAEAFWLHLPDGMALEMEWQALPASRTRIEALARDQTTTSTERCLTLARRALWLARHLPKLTATPTPTLVPQDTPSEVVAALFAAREAL